MITFSIIQKSQLEGAERLDAEYYQPEYLKKSRKLKQHGFVPLQSIAYITDGEHGSPIWDEKSGIKYFSAQHVKEGLIDDVDTKTISEIINSRNKRSQLAYGDILLSTVGTIGMAGLVRQHNLPANIDRHVARIVLKENTLDPEFLVAFLNSSYGRFQSFRESTGNVQLNLFIEKINTLLVPKNNEPSISSLVKSAFQLTNDSVSLYQQAEELLLKELGLMDFQEENELSYVVNFPEVQNANRVDADYFQPKYNILDSKIKKYGARRLTEIVQNVPARFSPKADKYYKYVELSNISSSNGIIDGFDEVLGKDAPSRAKRVLEAGDVIVSSVEGSLDKVAIVSEDQNNYLASTGFFQLRSAEILSETLLIIAKSTVMQWQMKKYCAGTILTAVPNESLEKMLIPVLPMEKQKQIADLVKKSHDARKKSKELLEEAKRKVEEMIEKGGDN